MSEYHTDHTLTGQIWHRESAGFINEHELHDALEKADLLLLGEKHDNPDHHLLRLQLLTGLLGSGNIAIIAMEMFSTSQQTLLANLAPSVARDSELLRDYLKWDEQGWNWEFYQPLMLAAISAGVPLTAANIDRERILEIYRSDLSDVSPNPLDERQMAQLYSDIDNSHCGLLPSSQLPAMVRIQQARDRQMAAALLQENPDSAADAGIRVLIAGNYHIRRDIGVPNYLDGESPDTVTLAFLETNPELTEPADYLQQFSDIAAYDYIWFTPAVRDDDYCAGMGVEN